MGICSSCLDRGKTHATNQEHNERTHLLHASAHTPHQTTQATRTLRSPTQPDPEQQRLEREELERICARTSNRLIDVTQSAHDHGGDGAGATGMRGDYARLFRDAFGGSADEAWRGEGASAQRSTAQEDEGAESEEKRERQRVADAKAWLKGIKEADGEGRRWDPSVVRKIEGKLTFSFEDLDED